MKTKFIACKNEHKYVFLRINLHSRLCLLKICPNMMEFVHKQEKQGFIRPQKGKYRRITVLNPYAMNDRNSVVFVLNKDEFPFSRPRP